MYKKFYPKIDINDISKFVNTYKQKYIAFFSAVLRDMFFDNFNNIIQEFHLKKGNLSLDEINTLIQNNIIVNSNIDSNKMIEFL